MNTSKLCPIISPSLLASDFAMLGEEAKSVLEAGADWLHVDVMDFHFVPNLSFGIPTLTSLRKYLGPDPFLDCHLMIENPEKWLEAFQKAGASQLTLHVETLGYNIGETMEKVKSLGMKCGLTLKPKTDISVMCIAVLEQGRLGVGYAMPPNLLLTTAVMTVEPGFGGQSFMPEMMDKVRILRKNAPDLIIQVDGGLNEETTKIAAEAGANCVVAGSSIFKAPDRKKTIANMKAAIQCHC